MSGCGKGIPFLSSLAFWHALRHWNCASLTTLRWSAPVQRQWNLHPPALGLLNDQRVTFFMMVLYTMVSLWILAQPMVA
jgi:hypothetical protein